jgi:hypothetical protein
MRWPARIDRVRLEAVSTLAAEERYSDLAGWLLSGESMRFSRSRIACEADDGTKSRARKIEFREQLQR